MGREARCACTWGERSGDVVALLESGEVVVRGAFRARAAFASLEDLRVEGDALAFAAGGENVLLHLGAAVAQKWAAAIVAPPPLPKKLGITPATRLAVFGEMREEALIAAVAGAASLDGMTLAGERTDVAIVQSDDLDVIGAALARLDLRGAPPPIWIVFRKGKNAPLGETRLRAFMRDAGWVDTKVASVSSESTALRFSRRVS